MDMLHLPFCPILVGVREPPDVSAFARQAGSCLAWIALSEKAAGKGAAGERCIRPGTLRKAGPEPGNLVRVAPDRLDGLDSLGRLAFGMQFHTMLEPISVATVPMKFTCVSIEEKDAGLRSVIVADAEYGPAGLGDAHIGFRDLRGRDGWPGRLPTAGRIGLQLGWLSAASERICSGRLSPGCTGTALAGSTGCSREEEPPSRPLAAWRRFPRAGQLPKRLLWDHKLACHASPHVAEDGSWTCPTCGDCFDDSAIDQ